MTAFLPLLSSTVLNSFSLISRLASAKFVQLCAAEAVTNAALRFDPAGAWAEFLAKRSTSLEACLSENLLQNGTDVEADR